MNNKDLIILKKTAARISLDNGGISLDEYKLIMEKIREVEEELEYEKKLVEFKINETKQKIIKNKFLSN